MLPATRGELYNKAVNKLLTRPRRIEVSYPGEEPDGPGKQAILERVALTLFAKSAHQLTFPGEELSTEVKKALRAEGYGEAPAPWANALRKDLLQNSGILRGGPEQGYFFLHLTIQEFLAASALARLINDNGWEVELILAGKRATVCEAVDKKAWNPRWQEVITLLAGQLRDPTLLFGLLENKKKDDYFRHRLALGARCLPELKAEVRHAHPQLIDQVTAVAFSLWWQHESRGTVGAIPHLTSALPALGQVNGKIDGLPLLDHVAVLLADLWKGEHAAEAVGKLGRAAATPEILTWLAALLGDAHEEVRQSARSALAWLCNAPATPEILTRLAALLVDADEEVRHNATWAMGRLGSAAGTSEFLRRLAALLADTNWRIRKHAAEAVGSLGSAAATPKILTRLTTLLGDAHEEVRQSAVRAVGRLVAQGVRVFEGRWGQLVQRSVVELSR
jgi:hypothetical protein